MPYHAKDLRLYSVHVYRYTKSANHAKQFKTTVFKPFLNNKNAALIQKQLRKKKAVSDNGTSVGFFAPETA